MESQPQNPEFRINPENFHTCVKQNGLKIHALNTSSFCSRIW